MTAPHDVGMPISPQIYSLLDAIGSLAAAVTADEVLTTVRSVANNLMSAGGIVIVQRDGEDCHCIAEEASVPHWVGRRIDGSTYKPGYLSANTEAGPPQGSSEPLMRRNVRHKFATLLAPEETAFAVAAYWDPLRTPTEFELKVASALDKAGCAALRRLKSRTELTEMNELVEGIRLSHRELAHRLKNAYASAIGVARLTLEPEAGRELAARLRALAAVHDMLDQDEAQPLLLGDLLRRVLAPYLHFEGSPIALEGEEICLLRTEATILGMVINELATNAIKYGALSVPTGHVQVDWLAGDGYLTMRWREHGSPASGARALPSEGSMLLRRLIEDQLGGRIKMEFSDGGISGLIEIPHSA